MLGTQWGGAVPIVTVLALGMLPSAMFALSGSVMAAMGQVERRLKAALVYNPVHVVGLLVASQFGLRAMAATWILTTLTTWAIYTYHLGVVLKTTPQAMYAASLASVPVALISIIAQVPVLLTGRAMAWGALPTLLLTALAGTLAWGVAVKCLRHPAAAELQRVLDRITPARTKPS